MTRDPLASHRVDAPSVMDAMAALQAEVLGQDSAALDATLGFPVREVVEDCRREVGGRHALNYEDPIRFLLSLIEHIPHSEMARFLLGARGCNWRMTDRFFDDEHRAELERRRQAGTLPLMDELLLRPPIIAATRERFGIFQRESQPFVREGAVLASLPCGRMRDLLTLDFRGIETEVSLLGVDKDPEALEGAWAFAGQLFGERHPHVRVECRQGDALAPGLTPAGLRAACDLFTSNGLNIYLADDQCALFYRNVFEALRPGGRFVTSHIVPPSEYRWDRIDQAGFRLDRLLLTFCFKARWNAKLKPTRLVCDQLEAAGFRDVRVIPDSRGMFPTFLADRPASSR
jgi:SAM-dependent methyltransferase